MFSLGGFAFPWELIQSETDIGYDRPPYEKKELVYDTVDNDDSFDEV